ncbi:MAG: BPSS1780 family membrane protein, partial [Quisquiliibacterium sp.]
MQISTLPASTGRRWALEGFTLLRRFPMPLFALTFVYLMILMLSTLLPLVGSVAPMLLTPLVAIGMMHAIRSADRDQAPTLRMLFAGFSDAGGKAWPPLLLLGLMNVASTIAALALAALADGGTLMRVATGAASATDPALRETSIVWAALAFLLLYTPVQAALWYAPMFVAWHRITPLKAMFFSLIAVLRNKGAFLAYLLTWFVVALVASLAVQALKFL